MKKLLLFLAGGLMIMANSCQSWDLSDPLVQQSLVRPVLEGDYLVRIREKDYIHLQDMLIRGEDDTRRAALKLVEYNINAYWFPYLLEASLDEEPDISSAARKILEDQRETFLPWAALNIEEMDYEILLPALELMVSMEYMEGVDAMIGLFLRGSKAITRVAAESLARLVSYDAVKIRVLSDHENPLMRSGYYQVIAAYRSSWLIPLLIEGLDDEDTQVWGVTVASLYSFGPELIPHLQNLVDTQEYRKSLAVVQILEQIRLSEGLSILVELSGSTHQTIAQRSAIQLQTYGVEALIPMERAMEGASEGQLRVFLWILQRINEDEVISSYLEILRQGYPLLFDACFEGLDNWQSQAWPELRELLIQAQAPLNSSVLSYLRERGDQQLVLTSNGRIDRDRAYLLLIQSSSSQLERYFTVSGIAERYRVDLRNLKEASQRAQRYSELLREVQRVEDFGYAQVYQQWERLLIQAGVAREEARHLSQRYFDTQDSAFLEQAKQRREEADALEAEARSLARRLEQGALGDPQGYLVHQELLEERDELARIWRDLSPSYRELGNLVYQRWSIQGDQLLELQRLTP